MNAIKESSQPGFAKLCGTLAVTALLAGCASTGDKPSNATAKSGDAKMAESRPADAKSAAGVRPQKFKADDGRTIDIGKSSPSSDGWSYKNPHMEKCWIADGFKFTGYDVLYIAPTLSTAKFNEKNEGEVKVHALARENLVRELDRSLGNKKIFAKIVTRESDVPKEGKVLKIENTITEFTKGGGAARYFAGLYGAGQPVLRVLGNFTEGDKKLCSFEARRSGVSGGARLSGGFMKDEDVQIDDIRSLVLDLTDFVAASAGKYQAK